MRVHITTARNGLRHVYLQEAYRDEEGRPRHRTVRRCGRLDDLLAADPEALEKLREEAARLTAERQLGKGVLAWDSAHPAQGALAKNTGWWLLEAIWSRLGLEELFRSAARTPGGRIDIEAVARLLVCARVIWPGSKKAAHEHAEEMMGAPDLGLAQIYQALGQIAELALEAQRCAFRARVPEGGPDLVFYDVTNYFFAVDEPDTDLVGADALRGEAKRARGYSKEHRVSPLIQMGLFCDQQGLPLAYRLFDGNVPDSRTLTPALAEFKEAFSAGRVVVVADKAMNGEPNIAALARAGDGWIVSASARCASRETRAWIADPQGWTMHTDGVRSKSRLTARHLGRGETRFEVTERQIVRYDPAYAARDVRNRAEMLEKAQALAANPASWRASNRRGVKRYVRPSAQGTPRLDHERAAADALLDGCWILRTSEIEALEADVLAAHHELWRIEESFRISKSSLRTRPVWVRTPDHLEAHFAICFLALLLIRLLERETGLSAQRLADCLRRTTAREAGQGVHLLDRPPEWETIDRVTEAPLDQKWATVEQLRRWRSELRRGVSV